MENGSEETNVGREVIAKSDTSSTPTDKRNERIHRQIWVDFDGSILGFDVRFSLMRSVILRERINGR